MNMYTKSLEERITLGRKNDGEQVKKWNCFDEIGDVCLVIWSKYGLTLIPI